MENKNLIKNLLIPTKISRINLDNEGKLKNITSGHNPVFTLENNNSFYLSNYDLYQDNFNQKIPTKKKSLSSSTNILSGNNLDIFSSSNGDVFYYTSNHEINQSHINTNTFIPSKINDLSASVISSTHQGRLFVNSSNQLYFAGSYFGKFVYGNHTSQAKLLSSFNISLVHHTSQVPEIPLVDSSLNYFYQIYPQNVLIYEYPITENEDKNIIIEAMQKWESVITGVPNYFGNSEYDNKLPVRIVFRTNFNSGSLASTGIISFRKKTLADKFGEKLPSEVKISLNYQKWQEYKDYLKADGKTKAYYLILHELGHALGIGSVWVNVSNNNSETSAYIINNDKYFYNGTFGNQEYRNLLGVTNQNYMIPLEDSGGYGTEIVHPEEDENRIKDGLTHFGLDHELMTGFVEADERPEALSRISVGMLQDLGYSVNYLNADEYYLFLIKFNSNGYLQVKGAENSDTLGGLPSSEYRTIYYNSTYNSVPYTGEEYPWVIKNENAFYHIIGDINLNISFSESNHLKINNILVYQYYLDNTTSTNGIDNNWNILDNSFLSNEDISNNLPELRYGGLTLNQIKERLTFAFNKNQNSNTFSEKELILTNNKYSINRNDINNIKRVNGFQSEKNKRSRLKKSISTILNLSSINLEKDLIFEKEALPFNINLTKDQVKIYPNNSSFNLTELRTKNVAFYSPLENVNDSITIFTDTSSISITNIGNSYLVREGTNYDVLFDGDEKIFDGLYYQIGSGSGEPVDSSENNFGCAISLTKNGRSLFVGDANNQIISSYKFNGDWISYLDGSNNFSINQQNRFGRYLDCNDAGNVLIVGDTDFSENRGTFYLYQQNQIDNSGISYNIKTGEEILGSGITDNFGIVGINSDGTDIIIGSSQSIDGYFKGYQINNLDKEPHHKYETEYLDLLEIDNYLEKSQSLINFRQDLSSYTFNYQEKYNINKTDYFLVNNLTDYLPTLAETNIDLSDNNRYAKIHLKNIINYTEFDFKNYNHFLLGHNESIVIKNDETVLLDLTYDGSNNLFIDPSNISYDINHLFTIPIDTSEGQITKKFRIVGFGSGSFFGDPHIITLTGQRYYFDYIGYFRLLKYQDENNLIIINALSQRGTQRWKKKQYIKKLFIKHNDKEIIIDLGFRGEKCQVIENHNFNVEERDLPLNPDHKIHCFNRYCLQEFTKWEDAEKHLKQVRNKHVVKKPVRNEISLKIENLLDLNCSNVNSYNFQPCRLIITPLKNFQLNLATGTIVDPKYSKNPQLESLQDLTDIIYDFNFIPNFESSTNLKHLEED